MSTAAILWLPHHRISGCQEQVSYVFSFRGSQLERECAPGAALSGRDTGVSSTPGPYLDFGLGADEVYIKFWT